jgi:hypothetical protein
LVKNYADWRIRQLYFLSAVKYEIIVNYDIDKISCASIRGTQAGTAGIGLASPKHGLASADGRLEWAEHGLGLREQGLTSAEQVWHRRNTG